MLKHKFLTKILPITLTVIGLAVGSSALLAKKEELPIPDLQRFTTVIDHIKNYYVNPVEDQELFESAIRGMLTGLDPHSSYLDIEEFTNLKESTSGKFGGLGIEVTMEDGFVRVIAPIDDTPAEIAGVHAGDLIVRIDDIPVKGLSLRDAVEKMRGKPGSDIKITVIREGESKPLSFSITRAIINVQSIKTTMLEPSFAYVRLSQFQNDSGDELIDAVKKLIKENKKPMKGMILDLRNNPGGVLDASVQISDAFLDRKKLKHDGLIVYTKGRLTGSQIRESAHGGDILKGAPIIVLVNGGSASASEIVAGALQDHKRALIMGSQTFGKGSVQTILPLKEKRGLKLTTALYYTPSGRSIQAKGIIPDIEVDNLQWPEKDKVTSGLEELILTEADLQGHLSNGNEEKETNKPESQKSKLQKDFQVHEALNVLKALNLYRS